MTETVELKKTVPPPATEEKVVEKGLSEDSLVGTTIGCSGDQNTNG
jgi:hypothetical protein